jgi:hypothetical protein
MALFIDACSISIKFLINLLSIDKFKDGPNCGLLCSQTEADPCLLFWIAQYVNGAPLCSAYLC